jgi:hypothetical protein
MIDPKQLLKVPFYSNTEDNTHCFQASIRSMAKFFWPEREYTWEELEVITGKEPGKWTWSLAGINWLKQQGLDVVTIDPFDFERFSVEGGDYLNYEFGEEIAKAQIEHCDIAKEMKRAAELVGKVEIEKRIPKIEDIIHLLDSGYIVQAAVNSKTLKGEDGYSGHSVLVIGYDGDDFIIHDPGLPPREAVKVPTGLFEKAWAYPNEKSKNILAVNKSTKQT